MLGESSWRVGIFASCALILFALKSKGWVKPSILLREKSAKLVMPVLSE